MNLTPLISLRVKRITSMFNSKIAGIGHFLPENVVTNKSLEPVMETTDEWIQDEKGLKKGGG